MKMNFIDRAICSVSPEMGRKRMANKRALEIQTRSYDGASNGRRFESWKSVGTDANAEIAQSLYILRNRSRDLVRNNTYAKRAVNTIAANVVGSGIVPSAINVTRNKEKQLLAVWKRWAETPICDFDEKLNMYGIQSLAMKTVVQSGACLIVKRRENNTDLPLSLQVLEPDYIDHSKDYTVYEGRMIIQGIEYDRSARVVAYWLFDEHPGSGRMRSLESKRVLKEDVCHLYLIERPGQAHGVPWLSAGMRRMKDFDDFEDAELVRQKIAACFAVFVSDVDSDAVANVQQQMEDSRVEPGIIQHLPPGKSVHFANPPTTNGQDSYTRKQLQAISAGVGVTYEQLTGDLSNVNFSSGRMGWIESQRFYSEYQRDILIGMFLTKMWDWFSEALIIAGHFKDRIFVEWTPPRREMIDPVKETKALNQQVRNGFVSWQEAVRQTGQDPDTVIEEIKADNARFDENDIVLDSDPRQSNSGALEDETGKTSD